MKSRLLLGLALASACALVGAVSSAIADNPAPDAATLAAQRQLLADSAPIQKIDGVWQVVDANAMASAADDSSTWSFSADDKAGYCAGQANPPTRDSGNVLGSGVAVCNGDVVQQYMQVCVFKEGTLVKCGDKFKYGPGEIDKTTTATNCSSSGQNNYRSHVYHGVIDSVAQLHHGTGISAPNDIGLNCN